MTIAGVSRSPGHFVAWVTVLFWLAAEPGRAAFVDIDEPGLNTVFSQTSFGNRPIGVTVNGIRTIDAPHLLSIDDLYDLSEAYSLSSSAKPAIGMLFVDDIRYCDGYGDNIIGCGWIGDSGVIVESVFSASRGGTSLQAHEVGHALGLEHTLDGLMEPYNSGATFLSSREVATIRRSDLVQKGPDGDFIEIDPYVVTAVPLPASGLLLLAGVAAIVVRSRLRPARREPELPAA